MKRVLCLVPRQSSRKIIHRVVVGPPQDQIVNEYQWNKYKISSTTRETVCESYLGEVGLMCEGLLAITLNQNSIHFTPSPSPAGWQKS